MSVKLYVGNLPFKTTSDDLKTMFSQHGTIVDAVVISDKFSGRSRGFGFVEMSSEEEAKAAIEALHDTEIEDRKIVVNKARPPKERTDRGGFQH